MLSWHQPHEPLLRQPQLQQQLEGQQQHPESLKQLIQCLGMSLYPSSLYVIRFFTQY